MSDGEMIERVARAISDAISEPMLQDDPYAAARGALHAMREPTERMVDAVDVEGTTDAGGTNNATYCVGAAEAKQVWHQMLDEALK